MPQGLRSPPEGRPHHDRTRSGQRAPQAEETLPNASFTNVHILDFGITAWECDAFAGNRDADTIVSQLVRG